MTNQTQPVNSCELAMMLDILTGFRDRLETISKSGGTTVEDIAWWIHHNTYSLVRDLDALRALVAEQEVQS